MCDLLRVSSPMTMTHPRFGGGGKCMVSPALSTIHAHTHDLDVLYLCSTYFRAMLHDPETYPDSENFIQERFIDENGNLIDDEASWGFGFC